MSGFGNGVSISGRVARREESDKMEQEESL
jgi:hypothetical protein